MPERSQKPIRIRPLPKTPSPSYLTPAIPAARKKIGPRSPGTTLNKAPKSRSEHPPARTSTSTAMPAQHNLERADPPPLYPGRSSRRLELRTVPRLSRQPPYTRGIHATGYRGKLWTMRMFSGFASPEETNQRYKYLLEHGGGGLSVAFDLPTLMGYDSDDLASEGEVGKCGVAIDSLEDMEILFDGIPLDKITTSMTINSPASVLWAMYLVVAEKQGADWKRISGTIQNDILKEYIAQKEYIYPPAPSMRLVIDTFEFGAKFTPRFNTISISGYHIREAGSTALQELAFTIYDGVEYVEWARRRGLDVDDFGPRLSFFFNAHNDFFEEIAKYRAARKIWYRLMKDRFGAKNDRTRLMRFHTQTAGVSLPAQQPMNNIARVALQALQPSSEARSRCTPTPTTKPSPCPPPKPLASRCARNRSLRSNPELPKRSTPSAAAISSRSRRWTWSKARSIISRNSTRWAAWSKPSIAVIRRKRSPKQVTNISAQLRQTRRSRSA